MRGLGRGSATGHPSETSVSLRTLGSPSLNSTLVVFEEIENGRSMQHEEGSSDFKATPM